MGMIKQLWEMAADDELFEDHVIGLVKLAGHALETERGVIRWWVAGEKMELQPKRWQPYLFIQYPVYDVAQVKALVPII